MLTQSWATCQGCAHFCDDAFGQIQYRLLDLESLDDVKDSSKTGHVLKLPLRLNFFKPSLKLQKVSTHFISHLSDTTL